MRLRHRMATDESVGTFTESFSENRTSALPWSILTLLTRPTTTPATLTLSERRRPVASSKVAVSL